MTDSVSMDDSEVRKLAADLTSAPLRVALDARAVVFKGAMNVKAQLGREMGASRHFKGFGRDIDFDILDGGLTAEIGPHSGRGHPGAGANIAYFGTSRGGGTVPDPQGALDAEGPGFDKAMGDLLGGIL